MPVSIVKITYDYGERLYDYGERLYDYGERLYMTMVKDYIWLCWKIIYDYGESLYMTMVKDYIWLWWKIIYDYVERLYMTMVKDYIWLWWKIIYGYSERRVSEYGTLVETYLQGNAEENLEMLVQVPRVHHESHVNFPGIETEPVQWQAGNWPTEP
jgi:hypothetical protein